LRITVSRREAPRSKGLRKIVGWAKGALCRRAPPTTVRPTDKVDGSRLRFAHPTNFPPHTPYPLMPLIFASPGRLLVPRNNGAPKKARSGAKQSPGTPLAVPSGSHRLTTVPDGPPMPPDPRFDYGRRRHQDRSRSTADVTPADRRTRHPWEWVFPVCPQYHRSKRSSASI